MPSLRCRYVFPVDSPPIENGVIVFDGGRIVEIRPSGPFESCTDLENTALLPGLVNAHTHLEFSELDATIGKPGVGFTNWIAELVDWRDSVPRTTREGFLMTGSLSRESSR